MKFEVYTLFDSKMEEFSAPFVQRENAVERTLSDMLSKSPVPKEDLTLWTLGTWDSELGILKAYENPIFVMTDIGLSDVCPSCLVGKGVVV